VQRLAVVRKVEQHAARARETREHVDHRVALGAPLVAGRQVDGHVADVRIAQRISSQRAAFDALNHNAPVLFLGFGRGSNCLRARHAASDGWACESLGETWLRPNPCPSRLSASTNSSGGAPTPRRKCPGPWKKLPGTATVSN